MANAMTYTCPKCGNIKAETAQIRASGGGWSAFFNLENKRYTTVSCTRCGYTELYKGDVSGLAKVFDFLGG